MRNPLLDLQGQGRFLFWLPVLASVVLVTAVIAQPWVDPELLFADALVAAEASGACCKVYYGAMSTLGGLIWAGAAAICLIGALALSQLGPLRPAGFLLVAGLFTGWLTLDDMFMIHEAVAPGHGVPQNLVLAAYVVLAAAYVLAARQDLLRQPYGLFGLALAGFAASVGIDVIAPGTDPRLSLIEDAAKFVGIVAWTSFHAAYVMRAVTDTARAPTVRDEP
ncbi:hypothetical protein [Maricaulis sp. CAU 1757]